MKTYRWHLLFIFFFGFTSMVSAQTFLGYYARSNFLMAPPGTFQWGLVGFTNPAVLAGIRGFESRLAFSTEGYNQNTIRDWGLFTAAGHFGFDMVRRKIGDNHAMDYKVSLAGGNQAFAFGMGYGWSRANLRQLKSDRLFTSGVLIRPNRYLSVGAVGNFSLDRNRREGILDVGVRPLGNARLTLFADAALRSHQKLSQSGWSAGAVVRLVPGISAIGRYFDDHTFTAGLSLNLGRTGISSQANFSKEQNYSAGTYSLRAGGMLESIFPQILQKQNRYVPFNLKGRIDYLKHVFFEKNTHPFYRLLRNIQAASEDPRISVIALNLSSLHVLPEPAWEIREALKSARKKGKKILIFIEDADIQTYHLASVADWVVQDPEGILALQGYLMGRTYYKGTLKKLGIGFDEWRFFKDKSAEESLSRDNMSPADRAQRQAYVDDWYNLVKTDISASRHFPPQKFDDLINNKVIFTPDSAVQAGLVDTLARWPAINDVLEKLIHKKPKKLLPKRLLANELISDRWGRLPQIAIVYGLGICAMDRGIKARWLQRVFKKLEKSKNVKAVVFRVDSPGGGAMASDVVAEALKKCSQKKPVIISQGQVAGSGGYWISMYGDKIIAGPNTITGSIGVIGGWFYDKGFSKKLGMTADHVQKGDHADLGFGVSIPFLGKIPERNLTKEERKMTETLIKNFYKTFVEKVASGRKMSVEQVKKIAQGHFYSGIEGKKIGLVDKIGGLMTALSVAKIKAGLKPGEKVRIIEIPKNKGLINLSFASAGIRSQAVNNPELQYLKLFLQNPGKPLYLMPPGTYPVLPPEGKGLF